MPILYDFSLNINDCWSLTIVRDNVIEWIESHPGSQENLDSRPSVYTLAPNRGLINACLLGTGYVTLHKPLVIILENSIK